MSAVSAWIMSILGIVITGTLIDLILPNGRMNKYIKSIFATATVLIIILPLPSLFKNNFRFDENMLITPDFVLDESYLEYSDKIKMNYLAKGLTEKLKEDGIDGIVITIDGSFDAGNIKIKTVTINLVNLVIDAKLQHINKYELIRERTAKYLSIDTGVVIII